MASIKGIELKHLQDFRGHEGETLVQGDVYYKGKKVGYYSQDSWGGCDIFNLDYNLDKSLKEEVNGVVNNYVGGEIFKAIDELYDKTYNINFKHTIKQIGYEYLFADLLQLQEHENFYKKYTKKWNIPHIAIVYTKPWESYICVEVKKEDKDKPYYRYNGLEDFIIE